MVKDGVDPQQRNGSDMTRIFAIYAATGVTFLLLDAVWLTQTADILYRPLLGDILAPQFDLLAAILFYLIYVAGIVVFAVLPARRPAGAVLRGAFLGLFAYATYDLTNQATLRDWPVLITVLDLAWGSFVTACATTAGYLAGRRR